MPADPSPSAPRRMRLTGLHHVTAICRDLDRTTAFYRDLLGLALVQRSVNDDDPDTRHFWFGDAEGTPGTLITFLEYPQMEEGVVGPARSITSPSPSNRPRSSWPGATTCATRGGVQRGAGSRVFRSLYLRDPDGHIVEIATRGPGF